jgi:hypothetical protein
VKNGKGDTTVIVTNSGIIADRINSRAPQLMKPVNRQERRAKAKMLKLQKGS